MANRMNVCRDGQPIYDIVMDMSFSELRDGAMGLSLKDHKICVVTDSGVAKLYLKGVTAILLEYCKEVSAYVFFTGEENKNLDIVKRLYEYPTLERSDRGDILAALGGGMVGDPCGFATTTYLRDVRFSQIPTTPLSQVDSDIGGKTGVDFDAYKNMVGAFHMPRFMYTNLSTLLMLSSRQLSSGMGEMIRHGLIKDKEYYQQLKDSREGIGVRDLTLCQEMVFESSRIKKQVVETDPTEQGERAFLDSGHTLGHTVEKLKDFTMLHGHCMGLGCAAAGCISCKRRMIIEEELRGLRSVFDAYRLPVAADGLTWGGVHAAAESDKKMGTGAVRFIPLRSMRNACVDRTVSGDEIKKGFDCIGGYKE